MGAKTFQLQGKVVAAPSPPPPSPAHAAPTAFDEAAFKSAFASHWQNLIARVAQKHMAEAMTSIDTSEVMSPRYSRKKRPSAWSMRSESSISADADTPDQEPEPDATPRHSEYYNRGTKRRNSIMQSDASSVSAGATEPEVDTISSSLEAQSLTSPTAASTRRKLTTCEEAIILERERRRLAGVTSEGASSSTSASTQATQAFGNSHVPWGSHGNLSLWRNQGQGQRAQQPSPPPAPQPISMPQVHPSQALMEMRARAAAMAALSSMAPPRPPLAPPRTPATSNHHTSSTTMTPSNASSGVQLEVQGQVAAANGTTQAV